jgi:hypothetical protein
MTHGQFFMLQMTRNRQARLSALSTVHQCGNGWWLVVIGGLQRGRVVKVPSRGQAIDVVTQHYNQQLFQRTQKPYDTHASA